MRIKAGDTLAGWKTVVGDAVRTYGKEAPVAPQDLRAIHRQDHSELQANIRKRHILSHNITYVESKGDINLHAIHAARYQFQLVDRPLKAPTTKSVGQTIEGGLFVWDGKNSRRDYGLAFQWIVNPWSSNFGVINVWKDEEWIATSTLDVDDDWHEVWMTLDLQRQTTQMIIDGIPLRTEYSQTQKDASWEAQTVARLQAEIVSIDPGDQPLRIPHRGRFRNWSWIQNDER